MQGQGSPSKRLDSIHRLHSAICPHRWRSLGVRLLILVALLLVPPSLENRAKCVGQDTAEVLAEPSTSDQTLYNQTVYDRTTKPFRLRSSTESWPLTSPGEDISLAVQVADLDEHAGSKLRIQYQLVEVPSGDTVTREETLIEIDDDGNSDVIPVASSAPTKPGVYELRLRLLGPHEKIWNRLALRTNQAVADTSTVWLVAAPTQFQQRDLDSVRQRFAWNHVGAAIRVDVNRWMGNRWLPDASRFVPGVKRVSESLPIPSWREAQPIQDYVLKPNENVVGLLPETQSDQICRLRLGLESKSTLGNSTTIRVEVSSSPHFDIDVQTPSMVVASKLDAASESLMRPNAVTMLNISEGEPQFVRVTNQTKDAEIKVQSLELFAASDQPSINPAVNLSRPSLVVNHSWSWVGALTKQSSRQSLEKQFAPTTCLMHFLWLATNRLDQHARWLGYDHLVVKLPSEEQLDRELAELTSNASTDQRRCCSHWYAEAFQSWRSRCETPIQCVDSTEELIGDAAIIPYGEIDYVSGVEKIDSQAALNLVQRMLTDSPQRLMIESESLPTIVERQLLDAIAQVQLIPVSIRGIVSQRTPLGVHVFVSDRIAGQEYANSIVTLFNEAPWTSEVQLQGKGPLSLESIVGPTKTVSDGSIELEPASIVNLVFSSKTNHIQNWTADFKNREVTIENLKSMVSVVVNRQGTLATPPDYNEMQNGGFEITGKVGIVGWMHTQFPPDAVRLDSDEASEGVNSIRLTADGKRAGGVWLVSEPIDVPASGRLAVSMAFRAEAKAAPNPIRQTAAEIIADRVSSKVTRASGGAVEKVASNGDANQGTKSPVHNIQVSLEGIQRGAPVRFVEKISVPCNGKWQPRRTILESERLIPAEMKSIRLTIDSLSPGKLWIDDVHLHDRFATHSEQSTLQGKVFLAIQGLQRGDYLPVGELFKNRWARQLVFQDHALSRGGTSKVRGSIDPHADQIESTDQRPDQRSKQRPDNELNRNEDRESVAERIRDWFPRPIRF